MDKVLSLSVIENAFKDPEAEESKALVAERTAAKKNKDFARADEIRNELSARGITIIDTPTGPTWKRG